LLDVVVFQQRRTAVGCRSWSEIQCWWSCSCQKVGRTIKERSESLCGWACISDR